MQQFLLFSYLQFIIQGNTSKQLFKTDSCAFFSSEFHNFDIQPEFCGERGKHGKNPALFMKIEKWTFVSGARTARDMNNRFNLALVTLCVDLKD